MFVYVGLMTFQFQILLMFVYKAASCTCYGI